MTNRRWPVLNRMREEILAIILGGGIITGIETIVVSSFYVTPVHA